MIVREIVLTCSNPHVARAAVASIGGDFARRFTHDAAKRNLTSGLLAAGLVRRFSRQAGERDWKGVGEATRDPRRRPADPIRSEVHSRTRRRVGRRRRRSRVGLARAHAVVVSL